MLSYELIQDEFQEHDPSQDQAHPGPVSGWITWPNFHHQAIAFQ